jgi:hypothetical protein
VFVFGWSGLSWRLELVATPSEVVIANCWPETAASFTEQERMETAVRAVSDLMLFGTCLPPDPARRAHTIAGAFAGPDPDGPACALSRCLADALRQGGWG